ncbi:MAG: hypothetical protein D6692_08305 [Planctomycetota bacterium]|nr:MAG: hypothetical protein D6692_08305 [Planctomycetota bacterium]
MEVEVDRIDGMVIARRRRAGVRIILAAAVVGATGLVSGCLVVGAGAGGCCGLGFAWTGGLGLGWVDC